MLLKGTGDLLYCMSTIFVRPGIIRGVDAKCRCDGRTLSFSEMKLATILHSQELFVSENAQCCCVSYGIGRDTFGHQNKTVLGEPDRRWQTLDVD